eukprot:SAG11_NODE_3178_length_2629_cov_5.173123_1_plen_110_part_00
MQAVWTAHLQLSCCIRAQQCHRPFLLQDVGNDAEGTNLGGWGGPPQPKYTPGQERYHADGTGAGAGNRWDAPIWPVNVYGARNVYVTSMVRVYGERLWSMVNVDGARLW